MEQVEVQQSVSDNKKGVQETPGLASTDKLATVTNTIPEQEDQHDALIDENTRLTISKESPLSEVATSPLPFDLSLPESDLDLNSAFLSNKNGVKKSTETPSADEHDSHRENDISKIKQGFMKESKDKHTLVGNGDSQLDVITRQRKDSYESSELSDLGDDESEAETDKMDFLDERDGENLLKSTDLQTLSELTELARLEEIDGDSDDEFLDHHPSKTLYSESFPNAEVIEGNSDVITRKRTATAEPEESESHGDKKLKTEPVTEHGLSKDDATSEEKTDDTANNRNGAIDGGHEKEPEVDNDEIEHGSTKISPDDEDNEAEAEDEGDEEDEEVENEEGVKWDSKSQQKGKIERAAETEEEIVQELVEKSVEETVAEENDTDINEQRELAVKGLIAIEKCFAEVRDKLYDDKLALLEKELQLCLDGSHPELSKIYQKINGFYQDSLNLANASLAYRLKCVDKETMATRTSIHQNYLRNIMDTKNAMITETTSMWYKINKEGNQLDQIVPDFNYSAIPLSILAQGEVTVSNSSNVADMMGTAAPKMKKAIKQNAIIELVQQRNNLNEQLGILNGLVTFHGFPSAVTSSISQDEVATQELLLRKASEDEINEDLRAMGIRT